MARGIVDDVSGQPRLHGEAARGPDLGRRHCIDRGARGRGTWFHLAERAARRERPGDRHPHARSCFQRTLRSRPSRARQAPDRGVRSVRRKTAAAFRRNPNYWRKAADGSALPYLDEIVLGCRRCRFRATTPFPLKSSRRSKSWSRAAKRGCSSSGPASMRTRCGFPLHLRDADDRPWLTSRRCGAPSRPRSIAATTASRCSTAHANRWRARSAPQTSPGSIPMCRSGRETRSSRARCSRSSACATATATDCSMMRPFGRCASIC